MFDKLSINTANIDEGIIIMNEAAIEDTIKKLLKKENIKITKGEFAFYKDGFSINSIQKIMLFNFFGRYFGGTETLGYCNQKDYIILLIMMKKILKNHGSFQILPDIVTGTIKHINEKSTLNKKVLTDVVVSNEYRDLMDNEYSFTSDNVDNEAIPIKLLANILNNKFEYKDYDNQDITGEEIKITNPKLIKEEVLRFIKLI